MLRSRVIPVLLLSDGGLVKTRKFSKPVYVGDPINAVKVFNDKEVDELIVLDIDAAKNNHGPNFDWVEDIVTEAFMPICYGGGIRNIEDAKRLFKLGVEKISIQTAANDNEKLISTISQMYGAQSLVLSVDLKKNIFGKFSVYSNSSKKVMAKDVVQYLQSKIALGVGEILLNFIDRDGQMNGYELPVISELAKQVEVPLIVCGGASTLQDMTEAVKVGADAVAAGSLFVFQGKGKGVLINYPKYKVLKSMFGSRK